jgi:hypothetical protein
VISGKQQDPYATVMPSLVFGLLSRFENKMKKIDLGQAIQVANVGVIAGIVFLGVEIHQNNEVMGQQFPNHP